MSGVKLVRGGFAAHQSLGQTSPALLHRGLPVAETDGDEYDDEASPEPSPSAPPAPVPVPLMQQQRLQQPFIMPPWTPQQPQQLMTNGDDDGTIDDESLPSLPNVPSPYSPPPSSLFSGEEFPVKSTRKQQRMSSGNRSSGNKSRGNDAAVLHDLSLNHQYSNHRYSPYSDPTPAGQQQQQRSQVLPTVLYLKKDLQDSHASMHLLQQENKALARECDRFQAEVEKWQHAVHTAVAAKEETLQQHISELQEQLSSELAASHAANTRLVSTNARLESELESHKCDVKELRAKLKEQSRTAAQKLKAATDESDAKTRAMQDERKSLTLETDRLKAMLHEANQRGMKDMAQAQSAAQVELERVHAELDNARSAIQDLTDEKIVLESELTEQECTMLEKLDRAQAQLAEANAKTQDADTAQSSEIKGLQAALADATERENELLAEKEALQTEWLSKAKVVDDEMNNLQKEFAQAQAETQALQSALAQKSGALQESYTKYAKLRSERDALKKDVDQGALHKTLISPKVQQQQDWPEEVDRLQTALSQATTKVSDLLTERSALTMELARCVHQQSRPRMGSTGEDFAPQTFRFDEAATPGDKDTNDLIPDRLGRMRDAAERAALVKEHRRELSRLKAEHDAEVKRFTARHDKDLKDVFEEAKSEVSARSRETRRRLQGEYDAKVAGLERRFQAELARVRAHQT